MKKEVTDQRLNGKTLFYEESFWTGRKKILVNGVECTKVAKNEYKYMENGEERTITVKGDFLRGATLNLSEGSFEVYPKTKWYEYVLALIGFFFILVWGNLPMSAEYFIVVGGAIGALISMVFAFLSLFFMRMVRNVGLKILIGIGFLGVTILACHMVGLMLVTAMIAAM